MTITKHTRRDTIDVDEYRADCELSPAIAATYTEEEYDVLDLDGREPFASIVIDGTPTDLVDLCDNCKAFIRDRIESLLKPLTLARRFTGKEEPAQDAPAAEANEDMGEVEQAGPTGEGRR